MDRRITAKLPGPKIAKTVWREDMPELVFSLMQKKLADNLRWHFRRSGRMVPCKSPLGGDIGGVEDVSCVITFFSLKTAADEIGREARQIARTTDYLANGVVEVLKQAEGKKSNPSVLGLWHGRIVPRLQPRALFPPLEYRTTEWRGSRVAVYSLFDLLGEEKLGELLKGTRYEGVGCVAVKREKLNMSFEVLLAQMQTYLVVPGP